MNPLQGTETKTEYFALGGGLDELTPAMRVPNGKVLSASNYEPSISGGYERTGGYERFDGHARPSDAVITYVKCTLTTTLTEGDSLVIGAATCSFLRTVSDGMAVTNVTGSIPVSTSITRSAIGVGTTASSTSSVYSPTALTYQEDRNRAADVYRALISAVPGSGSVLGLFWWEDTCYAFRNNAGGTAAVLHKSTAAGWTAVTLPYEIAFTLGDTGMAVGATLRGSSSAATATVLATAVGSGQFSDGDAAGRVIVTPVSGTFQAGEALRVSTDSYATVRGTATGAATQVALLPSGQYQLIRHNFYGQEASTSLYGCDGVNRAFAFDGTTFVPIATGMTSDTPTCVSVHANALCLSQESSVFKSAPGDPHRWLNTDLAFEFPVGSTITDMSPGVGDALVIGCDNKLAVLYGTSADTFVIKTIDPSASVKANTLQSIGRTYFLGDQGVQEVAAVQEFGNLAASSVSLNIQKLLTAQRSYSALSCIVRKKNQYRLFWSNGKALAALVQGGAIAGFTPLDLLFTPTCVTSEVDTDGEERVLVGSSDGYVYEFDRGSSFDGEDIDAHFTTVFNHSRSPRLRKRYRRMALEMSSTAYSPMRVQASLSFGDPNVRSPVGSDVTATGSGALWGQDNWGEFFYDSQLVSQPTVRLTGTGDNIAFTFSSSSQIDNGHTVQGITLHWSPRRQERT